MKFAEAVERHLAAVGARDLEAYVATLHPDVSLILPNGRLVDGRDAVAAFSRDWFDDPDWSWSLEPVRLTVAGGAGVAVFAVEYEDRDEAGRPYEMRYLLSLTFAEYEGEGEGEGGGNSWRLLHDQNTMLS